MPGTNPYLERFVVLTGVPWDRLVVPVPERGGSGFLGERGESACRWRPTPRLPINVSRDVGEARGTPGGGGGVSALRDIMQAVDLRPELSPPPVSRQRLDEVCSEIERIADLLASRREAADEAIAAFNAMTGHDYEALDFAAYHGSRSLEEFAREAARPARPVVADISRDELVEIVRRLLMVSPESDFYLRLLEANVSHPRVSDLVFHPSDALEDASAEQIVDEALKYRPIAL
ncbi:hypothetical protein AB0A69_08305 [Streptomyces sp. NPDC045431]|uniref:hypothetical protein n=1 Tax=Streptomyces sp. NPDC045431 TaxID=3155613 RepID=UPI00340E85F3